MFRGFANDAFNGSGKDQNIIIKRTMSRLYPGDLLDHFILFPFRGGQHLFIVHNLQILFPSELLPGFEMTDCGAVPVLFVVERLIKDIGHAEQRHFMQILQSTTDKI